MFESYRKVVPYLDNDRNDVRWTSRRLMSS